MPVWGIKSGSRKCPCKRKESDNLSLGKAEGGSAMETEVRASGLARESSPEENLQSTRTGDDRR